jgi:hypothetical protein
MNIQVLWNFKYAIKLPLKFTKLLQEHTNSGRVRIEKWRKLALSAIVTSGHVVCSVNYSHGGANSYFEAAGCISLCWKLFVKFLIMGSSARAPEIILAVGHNIYEFAVRVEYLEISAYGMPTRFWRRDQKDEGKSQAMR